MKLKCKIVEDLLPLYVDNVCSEESKQAVEEHLKECEKCRKLINSTLAVSVPYIEPERSASDKAVKSSFKKIRLHWCISILLVLLIIPVSVLGWNQYHNTGIHFTNMYEYHTGRMFMNQLQNGNYEKAYEYIDIDGLKKEWLSEWFEEDKLANIKEDGLAKFCEYANKVEQAGGIEKSEYIGISISSYKTDKMPVYKLVFKIRFSGKDKMFYVYVSSDGVENFSGEGSFLTDPLAQLSIWSEYLWQDYRGCYYDPELKEYVYSEDK